MTKNCKKDVKLNQSQEINNLIVNNNSNLNLLLTKAKIS